MKTDELSILRAMYRDIYNSIHDATSRQTSLSARVGSIGCYLRDIEHSIQYDTEDSIESYLNRMSDEDVIKYLNAIHRHIEFCRECLDVIEAYTESVEDYF